MIMPTRNASERRDGTGVTWFDQWEPEQRLWLLEHLYQALTIESIPRLIDPQCSKRHSKPYLVSLRKR